MSTLMKMALAAFAGLLIGGGAMVGAATTNGTDDTKRVTDTVTNGVDVKGPCDEAEHANDPRCDGPQTPEDDDNKDDGDVNEDGGGDVSGNCDEAEHAGDPACTGTGGGQIDNSGPGNARDNADDDGDRVDNSGHGSLNSGPGNADDDDQGDGDSSGSGHSGSADSGSGHSGSGSSGSGHSGDDD